ncbi:hypothetical protein ACFC18_27845 [Streptomyces sp. NPDC056121]|uniref:hypothetical protein n=1 Tax=unclassified Streptomyces TaxID=2593676 RepID=UPI00340E4A7A
MLRAPPIHDGRTAPPQIQTARRNTLLVDSLAPTVAAVLAFALACIENTLRPDMAASKNIAYGLRTKRWDGKRIARRVPQMLEIVELESDCCD